MDLLDNSIFDLPLYSVKNIKTNGRITDVYDGDTITVVLNLALSKEKILQKHKIRLYGIDTPELKGLTHEKGLEARNFLIHLITQKDIELTKEYKKNEIIEMLKETKTIFRFELLGEDKYGRLLANIYRLDETDSLNDMLLIHGYAKEYIL
jgi:micrococcal nuclease